MKKVYFAYQRARAKFLCSFSVAVFLLIFFTESRAQCSVTVSTPNGISFCVGQSITLNANATPLSVNYQWYLFGSGGVTWTPIVGATNNTLTLNSSACVAVRISNGTCSDTSSVVCVTATPAPTGYITNSAPSGICNGSSATLCFVSTSSGPYAYQWALNGTYIAAATSGCFTSPTPGTYTVHLSNLQGCDTIISGPPVIVFPNPATPTASINGPVCPGDTAFLTAQCNTAGVSYAWSGPNGYASSLQNPVRPNADPTMVGNYTVTATTTNGCTSTSLPATLALGCQDSVWPGDANYDYVVDNNDIFTISAAWGSTGPVRSGASNNWVGQYCTNWPAYMYVNVNRKHADCNGDGVVNYGDTVAISQNYSLTHTRPAMQAQARQTGVPDLYFDITGINFAPGAIVHVPLVFGSATIPVNKVWGIAGSLNIAGITPVTAASFDFNTSWIGSGNAILPFAKAVSPDKTDWTIARTDHHNANGYGIVGIASFTIPSNAAPGQQISLNLTNVRVVDSMGNDLTAFNVVDTAASITPTGIASVQTSDEFLIFPNPASGKIFISYKKEGTLELTDVTGKLMKAVALPAGNNLQIITVTELPAGMYYYRYLAKESVVQTGKIALAK